MRMSARGAIKTKAESKKTNGFGKKWNPGDTGRVLYPFFKDEETGEWELLVAMVRGHKADPKALSVKTTFIPSLSQFDEDGNIIGAGDFAYQFSRVARCFVEGQREAEMAKARAKEGLGEAARRELMNSIDEKYDTKNNINAIKPVISPLTYTIATECIYVPISNNEPSVDDAELVSQTLSDTRIRELYAIASNPDTAPVYLEGDSGIAYLEVQYSFPTGKKSDAGKTSPTGLTPEYRLIQKFPQAYKAIKPVIQTLPELSETIIKRNWSFQKISEQAVKQACLNYAIMQTEYIDALNTEYNEDMITRIEKNASIFEELQLIPNIKNQTILEKINAALELQHAQNATISSAESMTTSEDMEGTPVPSAPTIEQMLQADHIGSDDDVVSLELEE